MKPVIKYNLPLWLQDKKYLYPVAGAAFLAYLLLVIPFVALWDFRDKAKSVLKPALALTLGKVQNQEQ